MNARVMRRPNWRRAVLAALGGLLGGAVAGAAAVPYLVALGLATAGIKLGYAPAVALGKVGAVGFSLWFCVLGWLRGWRDDP